ncbi:MAG: hypothetical protein ACI4EG_07140 [Fusicatenibacter sp.]|nr:hypothetical protein [Fusicatenibacter sp.]
MSAQNQWFYDIRMKTPIGTRYGQLLAIIEQGHVSGWMEILKQQRPFEGSMTCSLLTFLIQYGRGVFQITGAACSREKE